MSQQACVCVFAKPPIPGQVKTRLAVRFGDVEAARLAEAFLSDTLASVASLKWVRAVIASTAVMPSRFNSCGVWLQGDGDLGVRLERILSRALGHAPAAIALGADSPGLPVRFLDEACARLQHFDAVLGPCDDGGFYLLGLRTCPPGLLDGIHWSAATTWSETRQRLRSAGLSLTILPAWFDIDRPEDLDRLEQLLDAGAVNFPVTAAVLRQIRSPQQPVGR